MKRTAAVILAAVMLLAASRSAFAATSSVQAPTDSTEVTADKPEVVEGNVEFKTLEELTEQEQEEFTGAIESLAAAVPEGITVRYLNKVSAVERAESLILNMKEIKNLKAQQLVDDEWVDVVVDVSNDGIYTVTTAGNTPISISFKLDSTTNLPSEQLIDGEWVNIEKLEIGDGIFTIIAAASYPAYVTMKIDNVKNVSAKQLINGKWVDVTMVDNFDGTYTVIINEPGFLAILTE